MARNPSPRPAAPSRPSFGARTPLATLFAVCLHAAVPGGARAQCFPDTHVRGLADPAPAVSDQFGHSIDLYVDLVAVGARLDDTDAGNAGRAFVRNALTGALVSTLVSPSPDAGDFFGASVAIEADFVAVGAPLDDTFGADAGTVFVFDTTTGALVTTISAPSPAAGDNFGASVALSGGLVVVGAPLADAGAVDAGGAWVFVAGTGALQATLPHPSPAANDQFGTSVAIDAGVAVVGAHLHDAGATDAGIAFAFDATTGGLTSTISNPAPAADDFFGYSVGVSGGTAIVGAYGDDAGAADAGRAYTFDAATGALVATLGNPSAAAGDSFGISVAISGNVALVGAYLEDAFGPDAGAAYVFDATTGSLEATLSDPVPGNDDEFGYSVAVDGIVAAVGAPLDDTSAIDGGRAHSFTCTIPSPTPSPTPSPSPSASPTPTATISPTASASPSPSPTASASPTLAPTASPSPSPTASPTPSTCVPDAFLRTLLDPAPVAGDQYGIAAAMDGSNVVIGVNLSDQGPADAGIAHVMNASTGALVQTLQNFSAATNDQFGWSVGISGNRAVVGARFDDLGATDAGTAYVLNVSTGALLHTLANPAPAASDAFGFAAAISGDVVVVGARLDDAGFTNAGTAYLFDASTGAATFTLNNPNPTAGDFFGTSVAVEGNLVVVGAPSDDAGATDAGVVYVFDATTGGLLRTIANPVPNAGDFFGWSVAISSGRIAAGALFDDTLAADAGAAYVMDAATGGLVATLANPAPAASDQYGISVAISGDTVIVGAPRNDPSGLSDAGSAYLHDTETGALLATIDNPTPASGDEFGYAVAIAGDLVTITSRLDDTAGSNCGAAYVYTCSSLLPTPTPTVSPSPTLSPSPTASPTASPSPTPSASPTTTPTNSPTPSPTTTITASPTPSPTVSPTFTPNAARSWALYE